MTTYQFLRAIGIAGFQGFDDMHVIADGAVGAVLFGDRLSADHAHMGEQIFRHVDEHLIVTHADDGLVEFDVHLGIFVELGRPRRRRRSRTSAAGAAISSSLRALRCQPRRHGFERRPGGDHLDDLGARLAHDIDATAGYGAQETFALELYQRLANRRAADAEIGGKLAFIETDFGAAAIQVHAGDDVPQGRIGFFREVWRACDWRKAELVLRTY